MDSLALYKEGECIYWSRAHGLRPLADCLAYVAGSRGLVLHDKVIGLAAARLIVHSGAIAEAFTPLSTHDAMKHLQENGIMIKAEKTADMILNRDKTGRCPMETKALSMSNKEFYRFMLP
jgi:hypothetical protein